MILLAELSLWVALLMAAWAALVSLGGARLRRADLIESGARSARMTALMLVIASLGLWTALLRRDFSVAFVASHTTSNLPDLYAIAAFWSAESGSLLLFAMALALFLLVAVRGGGRAGVYVVGSCSLAIAAVLARVAVAANPFLRLDWIPPDGLGLLPSLQHPGVQIHLLLFFAGCALSVIASVSGMVGRSVGRDVHRQSHSRAYSAWISVTAAMLIGMWSAYAELGWSTSWMLYPVESGEIFLWLALSATLLAARRVVFDAIVVALSGVCLFRAIPAVASAPTMLAHQASGSVMSALLVLLVGAAMFIVILKREQSAGRASYGAYVFLLGAVLLAASVGATRWNRSYDTEIASGATRQLPDVFQRTQRITLQSVSEYNVFNKELTTALVSFTGPDDRMKLVASDVARSIDSRGAATSPAYNEVGINSSIVQDIVVRIRGIPSRVKVLATIGFEPFVELAWVGCALIFLGGAVTTRPRP